MKRRHPRSSVLALGLAFLATLVLASCSDSGTKVPPPETAVFVPDVPSPADETVTLQPGAVNQLYFDVRVSAKGLHDVFGAAFWIRYDTTKVVYAGYDAAGSLLAGDGAEVQVLADAATSPGTVKIGIGRVQNDVGTVPGVDVTDAADLIVIHLLAFTGVSDVAIEFVADHSELRDSKITDPPGGQRIDATWAGGSVSTQ